MKNLRTRTVMGCILAGVASMALLASAGNRSDDPLEVAVSPQMLLLGAEQTGVVKVHTDIPLSAVDTDTLALNGVPAIGAYADALGELVSVFDEKEIKAIVAPPGAELTLTGEYVNGEPFAGTDAVSVTWFVGR